MTKPSSPHRVDVVFRHSALGDVILTTGFVQKHAATVGAPLYFVSQSTFAPLVVKHFPQHPALHAIDLVANGWCGAGQALRRGWTLARNLRQKHSQISELNYYDLHGNLKSSAFALGIWLGLAATGCEVRLWKYNKHSWARSLSVWLRRDLLGKRWVYQEYQKILPSDKTFSPLLRVTNSANAREGILLAPAASKWKKEWPVAHWESLIRSLLKEKPEHSISIAYPRGHQLSETLRTTLGGLAGQITWLDRLNTEDMVDVAAQAKLCVCSNSAWLHVSEAVSTPAISLEGPIVDGFGFSPWQNGSVSLAVNDLECRPCTKHGGGKCQLRGERFHACMTELTIETVSKSIDSQLNENSSSKGLR